MSTPSPKHLALLITVAPPAGGSTRCRSTKLPVGLAHLAVHVAAVHVAGPVLGGQPGDRGAHRASELRGAFDAVVVADRPVHTTLGDRHRRWCAGAEAEPPAGFGDDGYVLSLPGRQHLLAPTDDGAPDPLGILDEVRDWVMDELGHGWPELLDAGGGFVAVLEPAADAGQVGWAARGHRVPVGELALARIAVPPRWDGRR